MAYVARYLDYGACGVWHIAQRQLPLTFSPIINHSLDVAYFPYLRNIATFHESYYTLSDLICPDLVACLLT